MKVCTFKMKVYTLLKLFLYKQIEFGFCYTNLTNPIQVQILVLQAITKLTKQSFVLALLARSAYFALLCFVRTDKALNRRFVRPNGESIKSSYKSSICTCGCKYKSPICKKLQSKVHLPRIN